VKLVKKTPAEDSEMKGNPSFDVLVRDNDRRNRAVGIDRSAPSQTNSDVQRGKPTISYPNQ
jgi:hypothetical protein